MGRACAGASMGVACIGLLLMGGRAGAAGEPSGVAYSQGTQALSVDPSPPSGAVKLVFMHHSSGTNWLRDTSGALGIALMNSNYFVSDTNYGWVGGGTNIGNRTDIGQWWEWFAGSNRDNIMADLWVEGDLHCEYSRMTTDPGAENEVIMFMSNFRNSNLLGKPDDPPTIDDNPLRGRNYSSVHHTVGNAKGIYNDILEYFGTRRDKLFVVITASPVQDVTYAANARAFNTWLVEDWLDAYPHNNVAVFDFYNLLTSNGGSWDVNDLGWETGNHHRYRDGVIEYTTDQGGNVGAYPNFGTNDHASPAGNQKATDEFVTLLNVFYHQWRPETTTPTATPDVTDTPVPTATPTETLPEMPHAVFLPLVVR